MPNRLSANTAYLAAHFGKSLLWHASVVLFAFFLTETCGLSPVYAGLLLASTLALNGATDLALGYWQRSRVTTSARATRFQARGACVTAFFFALFCTTSLTPIGWRVPWALLTLLGFRFAYPFVDVAQNALIALGNSSIAARKRLTARRNFVSAVASLTVCLLLSPLLLRLSNGSGFHFALSGLAVSALMAASALLLTQAGSFTATEEATTAQASSRVHLTFSTVILMTIASATLGSLFLKLEPYFSAYALDQVSLGYNLPTAVAVGNVLGQPIWMASLRRADEVSILSISALCLIAAGVLLATIGRLVPEYAYLGGMLFGAGYGGLGLALWVAAAEHPERIGATWCYGALTCASKGSQAIAALIIGLAFERMDYRAAFNETLSPASMLVEASPIILGLLTLAVALVRASGKKLVGQQEGRSADGRRRFWRQLRDT